MALRFVEFRGFCAFSRDGDDEAAFPACIAANEPPPLAGTINAVLLGRAFVDFVVAVVNVVAVNSSEG